MRSLRVGLILLLLGSLGQPCVGAEGPRIHLHREAAPLAEVLYEVARQAGLDVYVGPSMTYPVTVDWRDVTLEEALNDVRRQAIPHLPFPEDPAEVGYLGVFSGFLVACTADECADAPAAFLEAENEVIEEDFEVRVAPTEKVVQFLTGNFPRVGFTLNPNGTSFRARGPRKEIRVVAHVLPNLDWAP